MPRIPRVTLANVGDVYVLAYDRNVAVRLVSPMASDNAMCLVSRIAPNKSEDAYSVRKASLRSLSR